MKSVITLCACAAVMLLAAQAAAQDAAKIADIEARLKALEQATISRGANIASTVSKAEAIQTEFATVKGAVDSNTHLINGLNNQMQSLYQELERRIQAVEDQLRLIQEMLKRSASQGAPQAMSEYVAYQQAVEKMNNSDYLKAAADFQQFLKDHPKSTLVGSVQFQIGECYFLGGDYQQAIRQFQAFIERNPRSPLIADALVQQGAAFVELGMIDEAKAFFTKVMRDYAATNASRVAKAKIDIIEKRGTVTAHGERSAPKKIDLAYPTETIQQQRARERAITDGTQQQQQSPSAPPAASPPPPPAQPRPYMEF